MTFEQLIALTLKQKSIKAALSIIGGWLFSMFLPVTKFIAIVFVLLCFDAITGVWAAIKKGIAVEAKKLFTTVVKFIAYAIAILSAHIIEFSFFKGILLTYSIALFISMTEFYSIIENVEKITNIKLRNRIVNFLKGKKGDT